MTENNTCIYALIDPRTDEIRYVGQTKDPYRRWVAHVGSKDENVAKQRWLRNLYASRNVPRMINLDWVPEDEAADYEATWIQTLIEEGAPLTNVVYNKHGVRNKPLKRTYLRGNHARLGKHSTRVFQYMDQIYQTEKRVASFSEVRGVLQIAKATTSNARSKWMYERGIRDD